MFQISRNIIFPWIFFCSCRIFVSSFTYLYCLVASSENLNWIFNQFLKHLFVFFLILFAWSVHFFLFNLFFLFLPYSSRLFVAANSGIVRFQDCQNLGCQIFLPQYVLAWLILPRSYSSSEQHLTQTSSALVLPDSTLMCSFLALPSLES